MAPIRINWISSCSGRATQFRRAFLALLLCWYFPLHDVGASRNLAKDDDQWLTFRIAPGVNSETLKLLAECTVPETQTLRKGYSIKFVLKLKYGYVNKYLLDLFAKYNPSIQTDEVQSDIEALLPAAPFWQFDVDTTAGPNTTLYNEAAVEFGALTEQDLSRTVEQFRKNNPGLSPTESIPGTRKLSLPVITRFAVYKLKSEYVTQRSDLLRQLRDDPKVLAAEIGAVKLVQSVQTVDSPATSQPTDVGETSWPFGSFTDNLFPLGALSKNNQVILAVVDTGLALDDPSLLHRFPLWQNPGEADQVEQSDDDDDQYDDDINGCTVFNRNSKPYDDSSDSHGTHVAGIATGRLLSDALRNRVDTSVRLMVVKVTLPTTSQVPFGVLGEAVLYAHRKQANIINISLEGTESQGLKDAIGRSDNQLFVVAAGNGFNGAGLDLTLPSSSVYPAKYAKEFPNVISVAAHDNNFQLLSESNYSADYVDVAAPGYKIKSLVREGSADELSGTSQAAPLVSLAAALIYSQGLTDPSQIKQRILNATDYVPGYRNKIRSEGKLNIAKAVSVDQDVIELSDHKLKIGRIISPQSLILKTENSFVEYKMSVVRKVILNYQTESGGSSIRISLQKKTVYTDRIFTQTGELTTVKIKLLNGQCEEIPIVDIIDIIPRTLRRDDSVDCP